MQKTNFITSIIFIFLIFIFILWSFHLNKSLEEKEVKKGFVYIFFETKKEIQEIWQDFKRSVEKINNSKQKETRDILNKEEIKKLKEKVLNYGNKKTEKD